MPHRMSENKSVEYSLYLRNLLFPEINFNVISYLLSICQFADLQELVIEQVDVTVTILIY
jgi:hypothetical protein